MPSLLSINNYYYYRGGAETVFLEQNLMFEAHGWNVVPFSMTHPKNLQTPWSSYFIDEIEFGEKYSAWGKLVRVPKVIYSIEARRKLSRLLNATHPDICHAHNIYHHISPSILTLLSARKIPVVMTLHDLKIACPAYNMLAPDGVCERCRGGRLYNVLVHRCIKDSASLSGVAMIEAILHRLLGTYAKSVSRFVVPSRFYIDKLTQWGFDRSLFSHVPNFVDVDRYQPQYAPGKAFLYFGRLSREKGLATLIRATAAANSQLLVAGTGPQMDDLRRLAIEVSANVTFLGYLTGDSLRKVIAGARAVVLPSEWYENAPMSVLEAYALGKPVIGAQIGGIPELIRDGETGVSFPSADVTSLTGTLRQIIDTPNSEIENMGRAARRWVEAEFTTTVYWQRLATIYRELGIPRDEAMTIPARA
jgi:glycosyltransferase involved in cell wall biosynthesis